MTVKPGTTVTWTNADDIPHTVVSKDGVFKSKVLDTRRPLFLHLRQGRAIRLFLFPAPAHDGHDHRQGVRQGTGRETREDFVPSCFTPRLAASKARRRVIPRPAPATHDEFKQTILPHLDGAYNLARYLTRDPVLSEDMVQDAVLRAFRAFAQFRGGSPRAWLFAIVRNCCRTAQARAGGAGLAGHA